MDSATEYSHLFNFADEEAVLVGGEFSLNLSVSDGYIVLLTDPPCSKPQMIPILVREKRFACEVHIQ